VLKGSNSIRVVVLAALVLAVAFSSTIASRLSLGHAAAVTNATAQSSERVVEQQKLNSAWQDQLSTERTQLQHAQQQQALAQQQQASAQSTLTPPTPTPTPTPAPTAAPSTSSSSSSSTSSSSAAPAAGGSIASIIQAAFASLGSGAVQWGLCIAQHESGDNPNAVSPSGAEGLFQFMPSTFANTPPGRAGGSIWDPTANADAAAWMYSQGQQGQWSTNGMC
jgi:soluble lytic murein transglycosylase-like protein